MVKNLKIFQNVGLDRSKEGFLCTEYNAKNLSSLQRTITEKNQEKPAKMVKNGQNGQKLQF